MNNEEHIALNRLLRQLSTNDASKEEFDALFATIGDGAQEEALKAALLESIMNEGDELETPGSLKPILQRILAARKQQAPVRRMPAWQRVAVAASILIALGTGAYFLFVRTTAPEITTALGNKTKNDVAPGGNKAVLTLANGATIILDSAANGELARQGNVKVLKTNNGQLAYNSDHEKPAKVLYNTLATPRGGQYQLVLPDGSKVWLNAASSIRYPTAFTGSNRQVEVTGEAYFEIARDAAKPFIVRLGSPEGDRGEVKVLGTQFNVNAYDDEPLVRTTLIHGAVQVKKDAASIVLKPGQQSQLSGAGGLRVVNDADLEETLAWKNGRLLFRHAGMEAIMRQAARWYDVDVQFKDKVEEETYTASVPRNVPVSQLLQALQETSGLHFTIEGKKIIVTK